MGVGSTGSSADEEDNSEPTHLEASSTVAKPLKGSPQNDPNDSCAEKSPRGYGTASLLETLKFRQAQLEILAVCASQGAMDSLRNEQFPRHFFTDTIKCRVQMICSKDEYRSLIFNGYVISSKISSGRLSATSQLSCQGIGH